MVNCVIDQVFMWVMIIIAVYGCYMAIVRKSFTLGGLFGFLLGFIWWKKEDK